MTSPIDAANAAIGLVLGNASNTSAPNSHHRERSGGDLAATVVFLVVIIIGVGTFFFQNLKKFRIPYSVIMFLCGVVLGCLSLIWPAAFEDNFGLLSGVDPLLLFNVFLPILIFEGSYGMKAHAFRRVMFQAIMLAGPGVVLNALLFAPMVKLLYPEWNWWLVMVMASLLSATDPVAVVALLKDLGVDQSLTALVDGEAILNDGMAIISFNLSLLAAPTGIFTLSWDDTLVTILQSTALGIAYGLFCGWLQARILSICHGQALVETFTTISFAFITFFVANNYLNTSGVIALCVQGIFLSNRYPSMFPGRHGTMFQSVWEFLVHLSNTLIFCIVGIVVVTEGIYQHADANDLWKLLVVYLNMVLARFLMIFLQLPILNLCGKATYRITVKECLLLTHAGLRGGVSALLALILVRNHTLSAEHTTRILFHTSGMVLLTTVVNATTSRFVVAKLGHETKDANRLFQMQRAHQHVLTVAHEALRRINTDSLFSMRNDARLHQLFDSIQNPYEKLIGTNESEEKLINRVVMRAFKNQVWSQRDSNRITEKVLRVLSRKTSHCIHDGVLIETGQLLDVRELPWHLIPIEKCAPEKIRRWNRLNREKIFFGVLLSYNNTLENIEPALPIYVWDSPSQGRRLQHWLQQEAKAVNELISAFAEENPEAAAAVVTATAAEFILGEVQEAVEDLRTAKGLSHTEADALHETIHHTKKMVEDWSTFDSPLNQTLESVLGCVLFQGMNSRATTASSATHAERAGSSSSTSTPTVEVTSADRLAIALMQGGSLRHLAEGQLVDIDPDGAIVVLRGTMRFLGKSDWSVGGGCVLNLEGYYRGSTYNLAGMALQTTTRCEVLKVPFTLLRSLSQENCQFERNVRFQAASHVTAHLLASSHPKYHALPFTQVLEYCAQNGSLQVAMSDRYQPNIAFGEMLCFVTGSNTTRLFTEDSLPSILPRYLQLTWLKGSVFFLIGGTLDKHATPRVAVRRAKNSSAADTLRQSPPPQTATVNGDPLSVPMMTLETNGERERNSPRGSPRLYSPILPSDIMNGQGGNGSTFAVYSPEKHACSIPVLNSLQVSLAVTLEHLNDYVEDFAEFGDDVSRGNVLTATEFYLHYVSLWCSDLTRVFQLIKSQEQPNLGVAVESLLKDCADETDRFLTEASLLQRQQRKGHVVHHDFLRLLLNYLVKRFPVHRTLTQSPEVLEGTGKNLFNLEAQPTVGLVAGAG